VGEAPHTNPYCDPWRAHTIALINALHPSVILVGERTSGIVQASTHKPFPSAAWEAALQATLSQLAPSGAEIGILEDVTFFNHDVPICLAAHPAQVQSCDATNPSRVYPGQQVAERAAAVATKATFVKTLQWLCTGTCSPIVGQLATYYDQGHVSASYAQFLSGVLGAAIQPLLT
jgi:hypothetical protein